MNQRALKILCVCGARPNFVKIAPVVDALRRAQGADVTLVHTGQHYDERMSELFFQELQIPEPDVNLEVRGGSHAEQTAEIMERFEPVCNDVGPDWVVVVGDVNSTLSAALVACKLGIKVAHIEAGLRSFDRDMPEEINRVLTDQISELLFVTEPSGVQNLKREGIGEGRIRLVGNVMIDTLLHHRQRADRSKILTDLRLLAKRYAVLTLHRPSNVNQEETLNAIMDAVAQIGRELRVVFPVHPRTRLMLSKCIPASLTNLILTEPLGYLDFLKLMSEAALVLTDSGGIQEETSVLGVPCLTLRENTERPITITHGTNRLAGTSTESILFAYSTLGTPRKEKLVIPLWDGHAAKRIVKCLLECEGNSVSAESQSTRTERVLAV